MHFTWGIAKDAAKFEDTVSQLARHMGTSPRPQSSVASKAMSTLQTPVFRALVVPTRERGQHTRKTPYTRILRISPS